MKMKLTYGNIELGLATLIAGTLVVISAVNNKYVDAKFQYLFAEYNIRFNYLMHYFFPVLIRIITFYVAFAFVTQYVEKRDGLWRKWGMMFCVYIIVAFIISVTNTFSEAWKFGQYPDKNVVYLNVFITGFINTAIILMLYLIYYFLKFSIIRLYNQPVTEFNLVKNIKVLVFFTCWVVILFIFLQKDYTLILFFWVLIIPYSVIIFLMNVYWLIPKLPEKKPTSLIYLSWLVPLVLLLNYGISFYIYSMNVRFIGNGFNSIYFLLLAWVMLIVVPISWFAFYSNNKTRQLKSDLSVSSANLNFFRSQINPHFLFNVLNTLYGTALQEHAERTGDGIQKLGDMMRFMLQDNARDKIQLKKEVEYLNNFIDLQKLRTASSPDISIDTHIQEQSNDLLIAPMLLIPFVENAFKHGISLNRKSFVETELLVRDNILYFTVKNSKQEMKDIDAEKSKTSIGLENVKQRLQLLYPQKHNLFIQETLQEYFAQLTITL